MRIREYATPRPHVVVDDGLPPEELRAFLEHVRELEPRMTVGMVRKRSGFEKSKIKENRVLFVDDKDEDSHAQAVMASLRGLAWSDRVLDFLETTDAPLFQVLQYTEAPSIQISRYVDAGQYGFHKDVGNKTNLTVLFFACAEPQGFTGGNFVMEHAGKRKTITYRNNRLLIFPSSTLHRVTPVKARGDGFECARFSLQIWPAIAPGKTKGPRSMQVLRREDQARHPLQPEFAVKEEDLKGSVDFYRALFSDASMTIDELQLGAFGRLGGRLLSNLEFVARSAYPGGKFQSRFHNRSGLAGDADRELMTRIYLTCGSQEEELAFGYQLRPAQGTFEIRSELFARLTLGEQRYERSRRIRLDARGSLLQKTLVKLIEDCMTRVTSPEGIPSGLHFLART